MGRHHLGAWIALVLLVGAPAICAEAPKANDAPKPKVKYKSGKEMDFEELLIQGRLKRPDITVITGDSGEGTDGLLKLRDNFLDRMSVDMAEEVK